MEAWPPRPEDLVLLLTVARTTQVPSESRMLFTSEPRPLTEEPAETLELEPLDLDDPLEDEAAL